MTARGRLAWSIFVLFLMIASVTAAGCRGRRGGPRGAFDGGSVLLDGGSSTDGGSRDAGPGTGTDAGARDAGSLDAGPGMDVSGEWLGTWSSAGTMGEAYATLSQDGDAVFGFATFYDSPCGTEATVEATIGGSSISGTFTFDADTASFTGTAIASPPSLSGTFTVTTGTCAGIGGTFELIR